MSYEIVPEIRVDASGNQRGGHVAHVADALLAPFMHGDRMHVGQEEEALALAVHLVLHPHPVADRAQIIAQVQIAGRLDAGKDAHVVIRSYEVAFLRRISALRSDRR